MGGTLPGTLHVQVLSIVVAFMGHVLIEEALQMFLVLDGYDVMM